MADRSCTLCGKPESTHDTATGSGPYHDVGALVCRNPSTGLWRAATFEGVKHDPDKPMFNLIPAKAELEMVKVLTFGAKKYAPENWRNVEADRHVAAAMRHINARRRGEIRDPESKLPHLAHAAVDLAFALEVARDLVQG